MSPAFCPQCGTAQASRADFCPDCGADLSTGTPPVVRREDERVATVAYAGFLRRFGAWFIDGVLLTIVTIILAVIIGPSPIPFVIGLLYFIGMEGSPKQATLGKMAVRIVVTDVHGERITYNRATGRHLAKFISAVVLLIGFLMVAWTERKQGLHDMIAGTLVVTGRR